MNIHSLLPKITVLLLGLTLIGAASPGRAADVEASLSAREAYVGAPLTLQLAVSNAASPQQPDDPVIAGVDVESVGAPSRSSQTTIINGRRTDRTSVVYAWRLTPRREGTFTVPSMNVQVDGRVEQTSPLRFVATKSETGDLLFAEVTGQQEKIYVGQALPLTLHVWVKPYHDAQHQVTLGEGNMWQLLAESTHWGAFADRLTEMANNNQRPAGQEELRADADGHEHAYYHYQIDATVYPKRPGQVDVGDVQVVLNYPTELSKSRDPFASMFGSDMFGDGFPFGGSGLSHMGRSSLAISAVRPVVSDAKVAPIDVLPIPSANRPADYRGAVGRYAIATHATPTKVKAGDPITLHMGISGDGPMDLVQSPPLARLPQLTADFQVPDEPLAGIVEGEAKLFTTTIRPRRAGVTSIPAIPLTYFDPNSETFETVHSEPITIEVKAADRLALDSIMGGGAAWADRNPPEGDSTAQAAPDFTNDNSAALINSDGPPRYALWWLAFLVPPLACAAWLLAKYVGPQIGERRLSAARSPRVAVRRADTPGELAVALRELPADANVSPTNVANIEAVIGDCERAAYGGASVESMTTLRTRALAAVNHIATTPGRNRFGRQSISTWVRSRFSRRRRIAAVCLAGTALIVTVCATTALVLANRGATDVQYDSWQASAAGLTPVVGAEPATQLSAADRAVVLSEANAAYQTGLDHVASEAAIAQQSFTQAAMKYQTLVDSGVANHRLFTNLGNAYLQSGKLGEAIANYELARKLQPHDATLLANLAFAQSKVSTIETAPDGGWRTGIQHVLTVVSETVSLGTLAFVWTIAWIGLAVTWVLARRARPLAYVGAGCLVGMALLTASWLTASADEAPSAVVINTNAVLQESPLATATAIDSPISEGELLHVVAEHGGWTKVETPAKQIGWLRTNDLHFLL